MLFKRGMLVALAVAACTSALFALSSSPANAAFQACACRCIDRTELDVTFVPDAADCRVACLDRLGVHTPEQLLGASRISPGGEARCQCEWSVPTTRLEWTPKTQGRATCEGDCAAVCGAAANVDPEQNQSQNTRTVDCTRSDHCAQGVFNVYAQRNNCTPGDANCGAPFCEFHALAEGETASNAYDGIQPRCFISPTALNADIECQSYGGDARGGVCRKFDPGENLAQYVITRPYVAGGLYAFYPFETANTTVEQLNARLNTDTHAPSLCELYGETQEIDLGLQTPNTNPYAENVIGITFGDVPVPASARPLSVALSKRYVCAVKKVNTCGTVQPETTDEIQTPMAYKCVDPVNFGANVESICFSQQRSQTELCVNSPGTRCCAEAAGGCYSDADCVVPKKCAKENPQDRMGTCEFVTVCDSAHLDRRCRSATLTERANSSICSQEIAPGTSRCGTGTLACCGSTPPNAISSCALDITSRNVDDFYCIDIERLRPLQSQLPNDVWVQSGSDVILRPFGSGGACLTNNDPAGMVTGAPAIQRCPGAQQVCCSAAEVGALASEDLAALDERPRSGMCGPPGFQCGAAPNFSEATLNTNGFQGTWNFQYALASSPYCQMTPLVGRYYENTQECAPGYICCQSDVSPNWNRWCSSDQECDGEYVCDLSIKHCVPPEMMSEAPAENCVDFARREGETGTEAIAPPGSESTFSCQLVSDVDRETNRTLCLQRGCAAENDGFDTSSGQSYRCCAPGTGQAPTSAAATSLTGASQASVQSAPGAIQWAGCIASGNCSLDEIIASASAFANFLIGISGSVFLAIFVYAGFTYLTAGASGRVEKAKTMIIQATVGMILILGAYVFVRFLEQTFISHSLGSTTAATCGHTDETKNGNYMCTYLNVDPTDVKALRAEISAKQCIQRLCPDDKAANYVCCPTQE